MQERHVLAVVFFGLTLSMRAAPVLPSINTNNIINVTNAPYNAAGDGVTTNTTAIQNAINAAALGGTTNGAAGGTVEIPAGVYLSGPLSLASSVNLQLDAGAVLRMLPFGSYPGGTTDPPNFISANNLHDVEISGLGAIDGQGSPWWSAFGANSAVARPSMLTPESCDRFLVQNITLSNSPMFHMAFGGSGANITIQGVTVLASGTSPNTDACDVSGSNILVENCNISEGDDDYTCGGGTSDVLLTNNTYGTGHGVSIGSYTDDGGVSNITVINCTFNGTLNGVRIKSDNDRGGIVQNINYINLSMTNVDFPIQLYAYYDEVGTPDNVSPQTAASETVAAVTGTEPIYRNITYSNITATSVSGYPIGIVWARTEMPATNIVFDKVNITGNRNFCLYNVSGAQFIDCNLTPSPTSNTFALFNAQIIVTNSAPTNTLFTFDGLTTGGYTDGFAFYNALGSLKNTNALGTGPLGLSAGTFTVSNNLTLFPATTLNYTLGTNAATVAVTGNLALGGTINVTNGPGFGAGAYTLLTYAGILSGNLPALAAAPSGFNYGLNTNTAGQVNLEVTNAYTVTAPPTGLTATAGSGQILLNWTASAGASGYVVGRSTTNNGPYISITTNATTSYLDTGLTDGTTYYYVVSATNAFGESANSSQASATPQVSTPTSLTATAGNGEVLLNWAASAGATGYIVGRSTTNNGPYISIVTNATTSYLDNGLANGTTYYYVVAAEAPGTQSANSSQVSATPINTSVAGMFLYEGFNYANPVNLTNNGGTGWTYAWTDKGGLTVINANSLGYTDAGGNVLVASGGSITDSNTSSTATLQPERLLGSATTVTLGTLAATNSGTLWMSYLWQGNNTGGQGTGNNSYRQASLMLIAGAATSGGGTEYLDLGMPNIDDGNIGPDFSIWDANVITGGTSLSSTNPLQSSVAANTGSPLFVLVQLNVDNSISTADTINVWLNPPLGGGVGSLGTPSLTFSGQDLSAVNAIRFQCSAVNSTYNVGGQQTVDEFRLGSSLASVTPFTPPAGTAPVLAAISNQVINVGVNLLITNTATDSAVPAPTLTFSLPTGPTNATLGASSGILNWQPLVTQANSTNPFAVVVTASGTPSESATQSFSVTVNPLASPTVTRPVLTNGEIGFSVGGQTGPDYAVESSTNLTNWNTVFITNSPAMPFSWSTNTGTNPIQFYRIQTGPPLP
jgi:hypothetical protein